MIKFMSHVGEISRCISTYLKEKTVCMPFVFGISIFRTDIYKNDFTVAR